MNSKIANSYLNNLQKTAPVKSGAAKQPVKNCLVEDYPNTSKLSGGGKLEYPLVFSS
jgi:hypothetical protein